MIERLFATLMVLIAGLPLLDFTGFEKEREKELFAAIHHGVERDYKPMIKVFTDIFARFLQDYEE